MVLVTGVSAGLGGGLLMLLLHGIEHLMWSYQTGTFLQGVAGTSWERRLIVVFAAGVLAGLGRHLLRRATGGHGGEVAEAIWFRAGQMRLVHTLMQAILSIVIVAFGASLGREGAPKQTGAAIASSAANWSRLSPSQHRLLVACGAGAGIAAVYNVPFGGALFALEVLLDAVSLPLVLPAMATSLIATAVAWLLIPDRTTYMTSAYGVSMGAIAGSVCLGPLIGFIAVAYIWLIARIDTYKPAAQWSRISTPLLIFMGLGAMALYYPQLLVMAKTWFSLPS
jgi:CIC family chloride channel protein